MAVQRFESAGQQVKFYQDKRAPNPRRARMFMAEKGVDLDAVEFVDIDIMGGGHRTEAFRLKNPMLQLPTLELDDGTCISESDAICRYFDVLYPEPALYGNGAQQRAGIEMWNRRVELNFLLPVVMAFRHGSDVFSHREATCKPWGEISRARAAAMFDFLDTQLAPNAWIAGDVFSVADITTLCAVDFARIVELRISAGQIHLKRWHERVSARPAAQA